MCNRSALVLITLCVSLLSNANVVIHLLWEHQYIGFGHAVAWLLGIILQHTFWFRLVLAAREYF